MKDLKISTGNIFKDIKCAKGTETFVSIVEKGCLKIKKIVSNGVKSPEGFWYNQAHDEFVLLLRGRARILFRKGKSMDLKQGDYLIIPKCAEHRIDYTSSKPQCVWLCVFGNFYGKT